MSADSERELVVAMVDELASGQYSRAAEVWLDLLTGIVLDHETHHYEQPIDLDENQVRMIRDRGADSTWFFQVLDHVRIRSRLDVNRGLVEAVIDEFKRRRDGLGPLAEGVIETISAVPIAGLINMHESPSIVLRWLVGQAAEDPVYKLLWEAYLASGE